VDGGVALVADPQAAEVVQVGEAALDDPALLAQPGAVGDAAAGDEGLDAARPQDAPVLFEVVAAVAQQPVGLLARPAAFALHGPGVQLIQQRDELGDVVAVAARQSDGQRDAGRVDQQMVFAAGAGTIDRGRPRQEPPKKART
jgi:hypothetical protein